MQIESHPPSEPVKNAPRNRMIDALHFPFDKAADLLAHFRVDPGRITVSKIPLSMAALALHHSHPVEGTLAFLLASVPDILDGKVARKTGRVTLEGAVLDALVDKIVNAYVYLYLAFQLDWHHVVPDALLSFLMVMNAGADVISQGQRGDLIQQFRDCLRVVFHPDSATLGTNPQQANMAGKIKAHLQCYGIASALFASQASGCKSLAIPLLTISLLFSYRSIRGRSQQ